MAGRIVSGHSREAGVEGRQGRRQGLEWLRKDPAHGRERQVPRTGPESGATLLQGARDGLGARAEGVPDGEARHREGTLSRADTLIGLRS